MVKLFSAFKVIQSKEVKVNNKKLKVSEIDISTRRAKVNGEYTKMDIKEFSFHSIDGNLKMKDVLKIINDKSKGLKDKGFRGYISSNINTPFGWKSSRLKSIGYQINNAYNTWGTNNVELENQFEDEEEPNIETYYDNDNSNVNDFRIFLYDFPNEAGCNGKYNDCVFDALKKAFGEHLIWDSPIKFKKFLDIERNGKVPFELLDKIEAKMKTAINVEGDYTRASTLTTKRQINLMWKDGHVELKRTNKPIKCKVNYKEKKPLIYYKDRTDKKNHILRCYDGEKEFIMDYETEFYKHHQTKYLDSPYITIPKTKKKTMKETYDYFIEASEKLKQLTKKHLSQINLCKTGSYKNTAIKLFNDLNVSLPEPEDITQMESEFILSCYRGGMLYSENGFEGELYKSDVKAMYPYLMQSNLNFPIREGQFKIITDDDIEKFFAFGIYRANVSKNKLEDDIVFHFNSENHYTSIDLTRARELNLKIELIQDDKPNFLYYSPESRIEGRQLFKPLIEYLIELETPDIKDAVKSIRNVLWGALCQSETHTAYENEEGNINLDYDDNIFGMITKEDGNSYPMFVKQSKQFKTKYARLAPFLTSAGRSMISKYISDNFDDISDVKRIHTDGLLTITKPKEIKNKYDPTLKIGDMVNEGVNPQVKIIHLNLFSNSNWVCYSS